MDHEFGLLSCSEFLRRFLKAMVGFGRWRIVSLAITVAGGESCCIVALIVVEGDDLGSEFGILYFFFGTMDLGEVGWWRGKPCNCYRFSLILMNQ